jgi:hypothetical protein
MTSRRRRGPAWRRATWVGRKHVDGPLFADCDISGNVHIHAAGSGVDTGVSTTYSLDLRQVLTIARKVGLVVVPNVDGQPQAFILAATPAVREWVEQRSQSELLSWGIDDPA